MAEKFWVNNSNTTYLATATTESIATHCIMGQSAFFTACTPSTRAILQECTTNKNNLLV